METTLAAAEELSGDDELQTHFFEDAMLGMNVADGMSSPPKSLVDDEIVMPPNSSSISAMSAVPARFVHVPINHTLVTGSVNQNHDIVDTSGESDPIPLRARFFIPNGASRLHRMKAALYNYIQALPFLPGFKDLKDEDIFNKQVNEFLLHSDIEHNLNFWITAKYDFIGSNVFHNVTARVADVEPPSPYEDFEIVARFPKSYYMNTRAPTKVQCATALRLEAASRLEKDWSEYGPNVLVEEGTRR